MEGKTMNNNKQSSIDWLEQEFVKLERTIGVYGVFYELLGKAKEMHKQESIAAQMDMFHHLNNLPFGMQYLDKRESAEQFAEQYYKETFGGKDEQQ